MTATLSKEIHLVNRPIGVPRPSDFELVEVPVTEVREGQVLVRNIYMSVDPYMRGRMVDRKSYVPPFQLNRALEGGCVGQVVASQGGRYKPGDFVLGFQGWREYFVSDGTGLTPIDPKVAPLPAYLGISGMPGLTAYYGLLEIGRPREGETVFVSAAAGAVGSVVCQIARIKGCRVVGSAGSEEKVKWLREEAGIDAAFNYKAVADIAAAVGRHCPRGIDVYYENVGGPHLEAALAHMNARGRIVLCGMISLYNATKPVPGPFNLFLAIPKQLTLKGFIVGEHLDKLPAFFREMQTWIAAGEIRWKETIREGIENAPAAFIGLFKGDNLGKMIVKLGPDPTQAAKP
ncbi:MAG: NADP-dependent oxidoreductase [Desulfobacterales bacterium]|nr:MAG: NADP-dependent oxidoreductase [Desulfobacterales bacterium]